MLFRVSEQEPIPNPSLIVQYDVPELMSENTFTSLLSRVEEAVSESKSVTDADLKSERSESALATLTEILTSFSSPTIITNIANQGAGDFIPSASYDLQRISADTAESVINLVEDVITEVGDTTSTNIVNGLESIVGIVEEPSVMKSESIEASIVEAVGGRFFVGKVSGRKRRAVDDSEECVRNSTSLEIIDYSVELDESNLNHLYCGGDRNKFLSAIYFKNGSNLLDFSGLQKR